jgi:hypothetical protein
VVHSLSSYDIVGVGLVPTLTGESYSSVTGIVEIPLVGTPDLGARQKGHG